MRKVRVGALLALTVLAAGAALSLATPAHRATAQSSGATVRVTPPAVPVKKGDERIPFEVSVENVKNMLSFQFELIYDSNIFEYQDVQRTDFITSTDREAVCNTVPQSGVVRFTCVTLRQTPPFGPDGGGVIATVYLKANGSGSTDIKLARVIMNTASPTNDLSEMPIATVEGTSISVAGVGGGVNWLLWGPVIGAAVVVIAGAGAFVVMKSRSRGGSNAPAAV